MSAIRIKKVVWFKRAIQDLISLKAYIDQDNPIAAQQVVAQIKNAVLLLSEQSNMGRPGRVAHTREWVIDKTPFILPYRVRHERIEILRVMHTARQWPQ